MVQDTRVTGLKISSMDLVLKNGLMVHHMKVNIIKARSMVMVNSLGLIRALILVSSTITTFMDKEFMSGLMEESSMEIGRTIKWKVMVVSLGLMVGNMLEHILMIWNKVKVHLNGLMEENTLELGTKASNMEKVFISMLKEKKGMENGNMVNVWDGSINEIRNILYI
jgi:hypothetical protein